MTLSLHFKAEKREENRKKKEQGRAVLLQTLEKEEPQFRILGLREKMKYMVKIQGKQFKKNYLFEKRSKVALPYSANEKKNRKPHNP